MDKDYLKELLNTYRSDKSHLWTALIVSMGGIIGLIIRAFNVKHNIVEIFFVLIGIVFIILLLNFISEFNTQIKYVLEKLKRLKTGDLSK